MEKELDRLFEMLQDTEEASELKDIESKIWEIWMDSEDPQLNVLMEQGCDALAKEDFNKSIEFFESIIEIAPSYAEGWNKRATAYYLRGSYKDSLFDIKKTLQLEKRHFGALSGLASICMSIGDFKGALDAFSKLSSIYPKREDIKEQIQSLKEFLEKRKN